MGVHSLKVRIVTNEVDAVHNAHQVRVKSQVT